MIMGNISSICAEKEEVIIPIINPVSKRENMATWHRTDIPVTDVYDVVETIGKGRMGEVYKVRRLVEDRGLHNNDTRRKKSFSIHRSKSDPTETVQQTGFPSPRTIKKALTVPEEVQTQMMPKPILRKASRGNLVNMVTEDSGSSPENSGPASDRVNSSNVGAKNSDEESAASVEGVSVCSLRSVSDRVSSFIFESDDETSQRSLASGVSGSVTGSVTGSVPGSALSTKKKKKRRARLRFQRTYACKTVVTAGIKQKQLTEMLKEIYLMRTLDHPYIIRLYEVYQIKEKIWMVMDLCTGGDLTTRKLNESQVVTVAEQILRGVVYLHRNGVCHQDLKLENILYEHTGVDASIRLIDFGISEKYDLAGKLRMTSGAAYTMSPEISAGTGPYTTKSDVWAIGVIVWVMLAGDYPFLRKDEELKDKAKRTALNNADYDYGITWRGRDITSQGKRFVAGCLRKKPASRWSAKTALSFVKETWVPGLESKAERAALTASLVSKKKDLEVNMDDITRFCDCGLLKQTVLITMANTMDRAEVGDLKDLFLLIDSDNTGTISFKELRDAFKKLGLSDIGDEKLQRIFSVIDHDNSGQIHYAEFLAALAESHGLVTEDRLSDAFDRIDTNGKGFITYDDLKAILGENYEADVVENMIKEADFKKNGQVDYDELLQLMFGEEELTDLENGEGSVAEII